MTVTISSDLHITLVAGTGVQFNASPVPVPAITTDDIYDPENPTQTVTDLIANLSITEMVGTATIDATAIADTAIYTVPARQSFIPMQVIFALTEVAGSGTPSMIDVGFIGSYKQLIDSARVPLFENIIAIRQLVSVADFSTTGETLGSYLQYLSPGQAVTVRVETAATYPSYTLKCWLFGVLVGVAPLTVLPASRYGRWPYGLGLYGKI